MKVILQATEINKPVQPKLRELFNEPIAHHIVCNSVVADYADDNQAMDLYSEIASNVMTIVNKYKDSDYYIITSGGVLHGIIMDRILREYGIEAQFIVYEPKIGQYVILPAISTKRLEL